MVALVVFLVIVGTLIAAGIVSAQDMRPQRRPREWSVGALIDRR